MLKVVYTAESITVTCLAVRLERLVAQRSVLAVRLGESLHIQRGIATLLLPLDLAGIEELGTELNPYPVDDECLEVSLAGVWLAQDLEVPEGVFLAVLQPATEVLLSTLWQKGQLLATSWR
jgi:hypothetical protein